MNAVATIRAGREVVTVINVFTVAPERQAELVELLAANGEEVMRHRPGFVSASIHAGVDGERVVNYAQWESEDHLRAMLADPEARRAMARALQVADHLETGMYTVASVHSGSGS
ncbi:antibiotic biosynthesis monooxygenase family protein [Allostreptomyces psammosilenae]|uniref:Quinol monooxygenase YgiN n=1 Tax=Allostreptomyces psammosilenae TaxID=1892865 RepID=A0A853A461_9ACTN|nr:antibiotic biosynthesis monooxygenase family protein [Allostreptomyces psammosilenae]NYI05491.1 quinol monooxygenase YgiN [Allostreptomyces psammosilenae]